MVCSGVPAIVAHCSVSTLILSLILRTYLLDEVLLDSLTLTPTSIGHNNLKLGIQWLLTASRFSSDFERDGMAT